MRWAPDIRMPEQDDFALPEPEALDGHSSGGAPIDLPDDLAPVSEPAVEPGVELSVESVLTASVQKTQLELQLTSPQSWTTDVLAHADHHALIVKDPDVAAALDRYVEATAELWEDDQSLRSTTAPAGASEGFAFQLERLKQKWPDARALVTPKKNVPAQVDVQFNELLKRLVGAMSLSDADRKLALDAGQIHALLRFRQSDPGAPASRMSIQSYGRLLSALHEDPALTALLRSMYVKGRTPAAGALTLVDLFCDRFHPEHALSRPLLSGLGVALAHLASVVERSVIETFLAQLGEDLPAAEADDQKNRVLVYTDWLDHIFPLEARLRQEGFQTFITDSLEACPQINRRKHPSIIILRLRAQPSIVIKAIHYLLSQGVTLTETPTFMLVDDQHIDRLTGLLALGIEDILSLQGRLDPVILKVKKVRSRLLSSARSYLTQATAGTETSGKLSDMNLIDLLQALGPSKRTAKVTLRPAEGTADPLSLFLNKGCVTFAELGNVKGDAAIHSAMAWHQGNWLVEQVNEAELPAPNTTLSNEAILIEGCRLLDENARSAESASA